MLCFSAVGEAQGEQEELVRPQSLRRGGGGRPVQKDGDMQQHPQPQVEAAPHCVSRRSADLLANHRLCHPCEISQSQDGPRVSRDGLTLKS